MKIISHTLHSFAACVHQHRLLLQPDACSLSNPDIIKEILLADKLLIANR